MGAWAVHEGCQCFPREGCPRERCQCFPPCMGSVWWSPRHPCTLVRVPVTCRKLSGRSVCSVPNRIITAYTSCVDAFPILGPEQRVAPRPAAQPHAGTASTSQPVFLRWESNVVAVLSTDDDSTHSTQAAIGTTCCYRHAHLLLCCRCRRQQSAAAVLAAVAPVVAPNEEHAAHRPADRATCASLVCLCRPMHPATQVGTS